MDTLVDDCILHICTFLSTQDKIQLYQVCKRFYKLIEFKNDIVLYKKKNRRWIQKYKPMIILKRKDQNGYKQPSVKSRIDYKVYELRLNARNLTILPTFDTKYITRLNLSGNMFTIIPNEIFEIPTLQSLKMNSNYCITSIPDGIGKLHNLKVLSLSCNNISFISDAIGQCIHLQTLNLSLNNIQTLPESIGGLLELEKFYLSYNTLDSIPSFFRNLICLKELSLVDNHLTSIPTYFNSFKKLEYLNIRCNNILDYPTLKFDNIDKFFI